MKNFLIFFIAIFTVNGLIAQDIIIQQNGDVIKAYGVDITDSSVYYRQSIDDTDNIKCIPKDDLLMIKKEDGSILSFVNKAENTTSTAMLNKETEDSTDTSKSTFSYKTDKILYNISEQGKIANYSLRLDKSKMGGWVTQTKVTNVKRENGKIEIESLYTFLNKKKTKSSANAKLAGFGDGFYISTFIEDGIWRVSQDYIFGYAKNMTMSGYVVEIPYDISVGDKLKTSTLYIKGEFMRRDFVCALNYENFIVVGEEDVVTPAGTFKCYKIEGRIKGEYNTLKIDNSQVWWVSKEIGIVKITTDYYGGMEYELESFAN